MTARLTILIATSAVLLLAGCVVGPNFKRPAPPADGEYTPAPLSTTISTPSVAAGEAQTFVDGQDIPGEWWALFHSQPLNDVIERSLKANPDIKAAQAALLVARENALAQRGAYYPSVTGSVSTSQAKTSSAISPTPNSGALSFSLYTPQVSVSYVRCVRFEPENRGVVEGAGAADAFCPGRDAYHAELERGRRRHPGGVIAGAA